jgi:hypothetical protein
MTRNLLAFIPLMLVAAACSGRDAKSAADSAALARDLELATQAPAYPVFRDSAIAAAPEPKPAAPPPTRRPRATAPATKTTPVSVPRPRPSAPVQPVERAEAPAPAPEAPASRFRGFNAGTSFAVATKAAVCTTNLPGDKIVATLNEPVVGENGAMLPAGTTVVLEVASVTPGDTPQAAQISLRVRSIEINSEPVTAEAGVAILSELERREVPRDKGSDKKKVVGGAVAGAIIGQIMGKDTRSTVIGAAAGAAAGTAAAMAGRKYDACLPAGSSVRVTTSQQIVVGD